MQVLLKPLKNQAAWKPVLARLKLLQSLAPVLGVGAKGLPPEGIMKFVGAAMASANADTRAAALAVAVQVGPVAPQRGHRQQLSAHMSSRLRVGHCVITLTTDVADLEEAAPLGRPAVLLTAYCWARCTRRSGLQCSKCCPRM